MLAPFALLFQPSLVSTELFYELHEIPAGEPLYRKARLVIVAGRIAIRPATKPYGAASTNSPSKMLKQPSRGISLDSLEIFNWMKIQLYLVWKLTSKRLCPRAGDTPKWPFQQGKLPSTLRSWGHFSTWPTVGQKSWPQLPPILRCVATARQGLRRPPGIFLRWTVRLNFDRLESYFQSPTIEDFLVLCIWIIEFKRQSYLSIAWWFAGFQSDGSFGDFSKDPGEKHALKPPSHIFRWLRCASCF